MFTRNGKKFTFNYGKFIAINRILCNMSQQDFADMVGVSRTTLSKWENNTVRPDIDNFVFVLSTLQQKLPKGSHMDIERLEYEKKEE